MSILLDKQKAIFWVEFIKITHSMYSPGVTNPNQPASFPKGWRIVKNINADPVVGLIDQKEFMGFVAQSLDDPNKFAVLLRGTMGILDALKDFDFNMINFNLVPNGGKTEEGFTRFYESLTFVDPTSGDSQTLEEYFNSLPRTASFTVAGYSLGGALATLHAVDFAHRKIPVEVYTFAAPMVGNADFVKMYNSLVTNTYRIANIPDIVPKLPGAFLGYHHVTAPILINSQSFPEIKRGIYCYHSLTVYIYALGGTHINLGGCKA